ncbi:MAG: hypothetical protein AAF958_14745, partial [Planctomycetota bacterium]
LSAVTAAPASACWLTDWLYGRPNPYAAGYTPYVGGFAPVAGIPLSDGFTRSNPFTLANRFTAARPALPPASPGFSQQAALASTYPLNAPSYGSGFAAPVYSSARPVIDNPSVITGLPVTPSPMVTPSPLVSSLRGVSPATGFGAANTYPQFATDPTAATYAARYGSFDLNTLPPVTGAPVTTIPATGMVPTFVSTPQPTLGGGLRRFFGSLFGTQYRQSYYAAPATYYRPVTSLSPVTGLASTTQLGCTGYETQFQQTPFNAIAGATPVGPPRLVDPGMGMGNGFGDGSGWTPVNPGMGLDPGMGMDPSMGMDPGMGSGVAPASGMAPIDDGQWRPVDQAGYDAPLTRGPSGEVMGQSGDDFTPMDAPSLEAFRPDASAGYRGDSQWRPIPDTDIPDSESSTGEQSATDGWEDNSYYRSQRPDDSGADDSGEQDSDLRDGDDGSMGADEIEPFWDAPNPADTTAMIRPRRSRRPAPDTSARANVSSRPNFNARSNLNLPNASERSARERSLVSRESNAGQRALPIRGLTPRSRDDQAVDRVQPVWARSDESERDDLIAPPLPGSMEPESRRESGSSRQRRLPQLPKSVSLHEVGLVRYDGVSGRDEIAGQPVPRPSKPDTSVPPIKRKLKWRSKK